MLLNAHRTVCSIVFMLASRQWLFMSGWNFIQGIFRNNLRNWGKKKMATNTNKIIYQQLFNLFALSNANFTEPIALSIRIWFLKRRDALT